MMSTGLNYRLVFIKFAQICTVDTLGRLRAVFYSIGGSYIHSSPNYYVLTIIGQNCGLGWEAGQLVGPPIIYSSRFPEDVGVDVGFASKSNKSIIFSPLFEGASSCIRSACLTSSSSFFFFLSFFFFFLSSSLLESSPALFPLPIPANKAFAFSIFLVSSFLV